MIRVYKYRIYPTKSQIIKFQHTLDLCRELYNAALEERREAWRNILALGLQRISIGEKAPCFGE